MKTFAFALLAALLFSSTAEAQTGRNDIRTLCADKWGTDYRMQQYCLDQQNEAIVKYNRLMDAAETGSDALKGIMVSCNRKWTEVQTDFRMVVYCAEKQNGAAAKLGYLRTELRTEQAAKIIIVDPETGLDKVVWER